MKKPAFVGTLAAFLATYANPALAQAVGGVGGLGSGILDWFLSYVAPFLSIAAIIVVGLLALSGRLGLITVAGVVVGTFVILHAADIYHFLAQ